MDDSSSSHRHPLCKRRSCRKLSPDRAGNQHIYVNFRGPAVQRLYHDYHQARGPVYHCSMDPDLSMPSDISPCPSPNSRLFLLYQRHSLSAPSHHDNTDTWTGERPTPGNKRLASDWGTADTGGGNHHGNPRRQTHDDLDLDAEELVASTNHKVATWLRGVSARVLARLGRADTSLLPDRTPPVGNTDASKRNRGAFNKTQTSQRPASSEKFTRHVVNRSPEAFTGTGDVTAHVTTQCQGLGMKRTLRRYTGRSCLTHNNLQPNVMDSFCHGKHPADVGARSYPLVEETMTKDKCTRSQRRLVASRRRRDRLLEKFDGTRGDFHTLAVI